MRCLHCDKHLGFFNKSKSAFCTEEHEELYRSAAQRRLEAPYGLSTGAHESSPLQTGTETARVQDLTQLLMATQAESGATVETPAEVTMAADSLETVAVVASSAEAMSGQAIPEKGSVSHLPRNDSPSDPPPAPAAIRTDEPRPLPEGSSPIEFPFAVPPAGADQETDRRSEPRVNAVQIVKVAILRDPEREMTCALVNTSDTGIQFTADTDFAVGEILVAELPDQLVLAEVRHSEAKDGRYAIGAERAQTLPMDNALPTSSGAERAELLIKALCDRVRTGFADEPAHETGEAGQIHRARSLERVARILEIWQRVKSGPIPQEVAAESTGEPVNADPLAVPPEPVPSMGGGRILGAVASILVIVALLMVCVVQYRKQQTAPPAAASKEIPASKEIKVQQPEVKPQPTPAPVVQAPAPAPPPAPATAGRHRAQIRAIESTWIAVSTDGHHVLGKVLPKGATQDLEYSKFAFVHTGNATGVEIILDGQPVPMGNQPRLRLVELNATGFRILRWSNDDPAQP